MILLSQPLVKLALLFKAVDEFGLCFSGAKVEEGLGIAGWVFTDWAFIS